MAVTYGFYNSVDSDRQYTAEQMGSLFDGILNDGIYQTIGEAFAVTKASGMTVNVGTGRAWFNNTWTLNDSTLALTVPTADLLLDRIDAVVIEVNKADDVRANTIKIVQGVKSSSPERPKLTRSGTLFQYPLAWITVPAADTSITADQISNNRGANPTPWITGPLKTMDATALYNQWAAQFNTWFASAQKQNDMAVTSWIDEHNVTFSQWFNTIQSQLDGNQAAALASRVIELENKLGDTTSGTIIYDDIMDSSGNSVLDSTGVTIQGKLIYELA